MASVDDIFKSSGHSSKRKLDPIRDPNEIYKSAKLTTDGASRHARVEDEPSQGNADDADAEAGPGLPPGDDDDFGPEMPPDDEEGGRFFGGGITAQESEVLDFVDGADAEAAAPDKIDAAWVRKTALNFEKHITKNAELRAKFEDQPQKFIASEADLDADIKALSVLSEHPQLYKEFAKLGCVESLVGLLAHENTDIAIDAVEIVGELTDEDVDAEDADWDVLVDALMEADLVGLIVSNFSRLNEEDEADRTGVYHALGVLENLCSRSAVATRLAENEKLIQWLLKRIQREESQVSQNKQYAAEILAILAQASPENRRKLITVDAIDTMLQLVAPYRRRDPDKGSEEEEYMENLFEALTCLADEPEGKLKFIEAEGLELCLIMLRDGKMSKAPSLRLLDHAVGGEGPCSEVSQKLVEAGGLKTLFTIFNKSQDHRILGHLLAIFASMLRHLPGQSAERIRTLAKFVENDYQKSSKLVKLHGELANRVRRAEEQNETERKATAGDEDDDELEVERLSRRLDAGLYNLQSVDVILSWLVAEDDGARAKIKKLLAERDESLDTLKATLTDQLKEMDSTDEKSQDLRDMLGTLIEFLQ
ncbi:hypothetical protein NLU13_6505 [Sarocladium strictum]|uniref:Beta-catenin-like protein 1 N-terminal domain-containing protein n=1 Tax=Sarocladium strictum TaxID=5046 RepID=A0AA39GG14_SARSR|nr:hypothetical protein NLU13_6505 [Sarocladium strictum]